MVSWSIVPARFGLIPLFSQLEGITPITFARDPASKHDSTTIASLLLFLESQTFQQHFLFNLRKSSAIEFLPVFVFGTCYFRALEIAQTSNLYVNITINCSFSIRRPSLKCRIRFILFQVTRSLCTTYTGNKVYIFLSYKVYIFDF